MKIHRKTEIVIGALYAIGAGFQTFDTLGKSEEFYQAMADQAWVPPAQTFIETALIPNSVAVTILVIGFEAAAAIAILTRGFAVRPALLGGGVFSIVGALTGGPVETVGYAALAALHFKLAADRRTTQVPAPSPVN